MKKHLVIIFFLSLLSMMHATAQEFNGEYRHRTFVMGVPQHLFQNGIRIEIDKNLSNPQNWIIFSPTIYYKENKDNWFLWGSDLLGIKGAGLDLMYRWYLNGLNKHGGFYLSAGGGYRLVNLEYDGYSWESFDENGIDYLRYNDSPWKKDIQTFNLKTTAGYQLIIDRNLAIDFFLGLGMKLSSEKLPENIQTYDDDDVYTYGGTGFVFVGGLRIGVGW